MNVADMDFAEGKPVKKLTLTGGAILSGNTAEKFEQAAPFKFLPADATDTKPSDGTK